MAVTHSYSFARNKGIITFTDEGTNKVYNFNINTGEFTSGATGKQIKNCPAGFAKFLEQNAKKDTVLWLLAACQRNPGRYNLPTSPSGCSINNFTCLTQMATYFNLLDKMQSLGARINSYIGYLSIDDLQELNTYFKDFVKYCHETKEPSINDFLNRDGLPYFISRHNLQRYNLPNSILYTLYEHRHDFPLEYMDIIIYHLTHGLYDFDKDRATIYLHRYFSLCDKLDIKPSKDEFYRSYVNLTRKYEMRKREIDTATLAKVYDQKRNALTFEMGDYFALIPQTSADFEQEGDNQHNCVFTMYLNKVLNSQTRVVFIRCKNAPEKSVVTCEVNNDGTICQFLGHCNTEIKDEELLAFKKAYSKHLCKNWCS